MKEEIQMKELNIQIAMGHDRGRDLGRIEGFCLASIYPIIMLIILLLTSGAIK